MRDQQNKTSLHLHDLSSLTETYSLLSKKYLNHQDQELYHFHLQMLQTLSKKIEELLAALTPTQCFIKSRRIHLKTRKNIFLIQYDHFAEIEFYAEDIFKHKDLLEKLSAEDLYAIAYTHAVEDSLYDQQQINDFKQNKQFPRTIN